MVTDLNPSILPAGRVLPVVRRGPQEDRDARQRQQHPPNKAQPGTPSANTNAPAAQHTTSNENTSAPDHDQPGGVIDDYV